jgi:hypothetical protein
MTYWSFLPTEPGGRLFIHALISWPLQTIYIVPPENCLHTYQVAIQDALQQLV